MTPRRGEAGRGSGASRDQAPSPSGPALVPLLLGALFLRLIIAYVLFPNSGFKTDVGTFEAWAISLAHYGPGGFYQHGGFADYAPGYLYILWLVGWLSQRLAGLTNGDAFGFAAQLVKLPAILFDLGLGYLIYRAVLRWRGERAALIGAGLFLFNAVTWYVSALWGQVDAVGTLVLLVAILWLIEGWSEASAAAAVTAALIKPQYLIVVFAVGVVLLTRHLLRPGSGPVPTVRRPWALRLNAALGGWFTAEQGPWRLVSSAAVGLVTLFVLITPFDLAELAAAQVPALGIGGDLGGLLVVFGQAAGEYHFLTLNAYNPWALVGDMSLAHTWLWNAQSDLVPSPLGVSWFAIGAFLLAVALTFLAYVLIRRNDRRTILVATTVLALAFFILPTRVHERYLFPAFALGALIAAGSVAWRWWYAALSAGTLVNIHAVLTYPLYGTPNVVSLPFGDLSRSEPVVTFIAVSLTALFAWTVWQLRAVVPEAFTWLRWRRTPVDGSPPSAPFVWRTPWTPPPSPDARPLPIEPLPTDSAAAPEPTTPPEVADIAERERPLSAPAWWSTLTRRLTLPPIRANRSALLRFERGGRVDRLDLLAIAVILVVGLSLRLFRADQPFQMVTLDEVYHARTATEFLEDWRYGIPHPIYEYTHPHLAKYLMAVGIVALGDDRVVGKSDLGDPVRSVAVEPAYTSVDDPGQRAGDRLFVATGSSVRVLDLASGGDEASLPVGAAAVAVDRSAHRMYAGGASGVIWSLDTSMLDRWRSIGGDPQALEPVELARIDAPVDRIWAVGPDGIVVLSGTSLISVDPTSGDILARRDAPQIGGAIAVGTVTTLVAHSEAVADPAGEAHTIADLTGLDATTVEAQLRATGTTPAGKRLMSYLSSDQRSAVQSAIDSDQLAGIEVLDQTPLVAAVPTGVDVIDPASLDTVATVKLEAGAQGLDAVGQGTDQRLYVALSDSRVQIVHLDPAAPPTGAESFQMPGLVRDVRWDEATNLVHVLGATSSGQPTVYVVEPHGNAVFADAALPFQPVAWTLDVQPASPTADREHALLFSADGQAATVDVGQNAFAWRFPGIVLGVLMAVALYLLARFLFRRRSVALFTAAAVLTDGMLFAHSRDAMNDAYCGFFIVAAFTVLAWLWLPGARRGVLAVVLGLPAVGILLGLATASKWAGVFAIGAALLLVMLRSALGRFLALAGMVLLAGVLGNLALATGNLTFAVLMLALTLLMAAALPWRPMAFSRDEIRFAAAAPLALGVVLLLAGLAGRGPSARVGVAELDLPLTLAAGTLFLAVGAAAWAWSSIATARGWLPVADRDGALRELPPGIPEDRPALPPRGWLRPGARGGAPIAYALVCLTVVPLLVYVLSYVPWARPWDPNCTAQANDCPQIIPATVGPLGSTISEGWPPGHRGQTLYDLTINMYDYHNDLRATHPASSPWWAWPLDLKPVWLYQDPNAGATSAVVFDAGNLVTFWLSIPAIGFGLWQAWRRRSLALGFVAVIFLAQWLAWARIDRVTFQYHYYTALPFAFLFLGYFLAELWHGPSPRTWALARVAAAVAILGPGLTWLLKDPLCAVAGVQSVDPTSYLCTNVSGTVVIPTSLIAIVAVLLIGLGLLARELVVIGRTAAFATGGAGSGLNLDGTRLADIGRIAIIVLAVGVAATVMPRLAGSGTFTFTASIGQAWVVGLAYLAGSATFAWLALGARDPRRAVVLIVGAAALWFVIFYPYISDLPLPSGAPYTYQRLLSTFDYSFQFANNQAPSPKIGIFDPQGLVLVASIGVAALVAFLLVRQWRLDRMALDAEASPPS